MVLRWAFIAILTVTAFHRDPRERVGDHRRRRAAAATCGGAGRSRWPRGSARRHRNELPIHDRQTDIIVGIMGLVLALLVQGVLLDR